ncbi:hypothetical protein BN871_ES_00010 [Paenibacillus sp. P22]|nr:hypothetical protein BN871_ES_00010 [Paenibacillus sp. P22]
MAIEVSVDVGADELAHLPSQLSRRRERASFRTHDYSAVSGDEYIRMRGGLQAFRNRGAAAVDFDAGVGHDSRALHAARPDDRARFDRAAVLQGYGRAFHFRNRQAGFEHDAALLEGSRRALDQLGREARQDRRSSLDAVQGNFVIADAVFFHEAGQHVGEFAHKLDARQTAAADDKGQVGFVAGLLVLRHGCFDMGFQLVRVCNGFQREAVLLQAWNAEECRLAAQCDNKRIVGQSRAGRQLHLLLVRLDFSDFADFQVDVFAAQQLVQRKRHIAFGQVADGKTVQLGDDLVRVDPVDNGNLGFLRRKVRACRRSGQQAAVAAAQDKNMLRHVHPPFTFYAASPRGVRGLVLVLLLFAEIVQECLRETQRALDVRVLQHAQQAEEAYAGRLVADLVAGFDSRLGDGLGLVDDRLHHLAETASEVVDKHFVRRERLGYIVGFGHERDDFGQLRKIIHKYRKGLLNFRLHELVENIALLYRRGWLLSRHRLSWLVFGHGITSSFALEMRFRPSVVRDFLRPLLSTSAGSRPRAGTLSSCAQRMGAASMRNHAVVAGLSLYQNSHISPDHQTFMLTQKNGRFQPGHRENVE